MYDTVAIIFCGFGQITSIVKFMLEIYIHPVPAQARIGDILLVTYYP